MTYQRRRQGNLFENNRHEIQIPLQDRARLVAFLEELLCEALVDPHAQTSLKIEEADNE